jgi:RNA polymerase sigma-70 factor, ECF subfamily
MTEPVQATESPPQSLVLFTFEAFYEAENLALFRRFWLVTGNRAEAEEIVQEAFLRIWERWDRVGLMDDPVAYLYTTAMNIFRRRYRRGALALRRTVGRAPGRDDFADVEDRDVVRRMLASLPPRQRAALVLTELLGFSAKEAGRVLGVQASTIRSLTRNARESVHRLEATDA